MSPDGPAAQQPPMPRQSSSPSQLVEHQLVGGTVSNV
jgi:hypothetical protein